MEIMIKKSPLGTPSRAFTILEILIVVAVIAVLAGIVLLGISNVRNKARYSRSIEEFHQISSAMELYYQKNGDYPIDVTRDLPPGAEQYITGGVWPKAPYPGSVYDWEHWQPPQLADDPKEEIVQISIRFCPVGQPTQCIFPNEPWAAGFGVNSALYYCIKGPCRAHSGEDITYPAYCVNCD